MKKIYFPKQAAALSLGLAFSAAVGVTQAEAATKAGACYTTYLHCLKASRGNPDQEAHCEKSYAYCLSQAGVTRASVDQILGNAFSAADASSLDEFLSDIE
jgi:hypothetical protein